MVTRLTGLLIGIAAAATALAGCSDSSKAAAPARAQAVKTEPVTVQDVPISVEYVGTVVGYINALIRARVAGHLVSQNYREGYLVHAGDLLFQVDSRPFQTAVEQAAAKVALAESPVGGRRVIFLSRDHPEPTAFIRR